MNIRYDIIYVVKNNSTRSMQYLFNIESLKSAIISEASMEGKK